MLAIAVAIGASPLASEAADERLVDLQLVDRVNGQSRCERRPIRPLVVQLGNELRVAAGAADCPFRRRLTYK